MLPAGFGLPAPVSSGGFVVLPDVPVVLGLDDELPLVPVVLGFDVPRVPAPVVLDPVVLPDRARVRVPVRAPRRAVVPGAHGT